MAKGTPATLALARSGVSFDLIAYDYDPRALGAGLQAAETLKEPPGRVLKTLIAQVDGRPVCLILPSDRAASMKKVAAAFGGKVAGMMSPVDAERITGYKVGGVSPFGQRRRLPTLLDVAALAHPYVFVNGGQRGLQVRLAPDDLRRTSGAEISSLSTD